MCGTLPEPEPTDLSDVRIMVIKMIMKGLRTALKNIEQRRLFANCLHQRLDCRDQQGHPVLPCTMGRAYQR